MIKKAVVLFLLFTVSISQYAQVLNPVKWEFSSKKITPTVFELTFTAKIDKGWHMYGLNIPPDGPVPTKFTFENENNLKFLGSRNVVTRTKAPMSTPGSVPKTTLQVNGHTIRPSLQ